MLDKLLSTTVLCGSLIIAGSAVAQSTTSSYCNEGYKPADTDGDNVISEEELTMVRDAEFDDMDADDDGIVSREEYSNCMDAWAANSVTEAADEQDLAEFDADGDGQISIDEFMAGIDETAAMQPEEGSTQQTAASGDATENAEGGNASEPVTILRRVVIVPRTYDDSRLRSMSRDELAARSAQRFVTTDADGDRQISQEEWLNAAQDNMVKIKTVLDREFETFDTDGSGDVSRLEYYTHGLERWKQAQLTAEDKGTMQPEGPGAPIVYFRYPSTM